MNNKSNIQKGTKLKAITDFETSGLIHFSTSYTGSFECTVPKGSIFTVPDIPASGAEGFYVEAEDESYFLQFIAKSDLNRNIFDGYSFVFLHADLGNHFEIL